MQVRALYVSRAAGPQTTTVTGSILLAQTHKQTDGINGLLCRGQGLYPEVLEGERSAVNRLYACIVSDARH